jgi:hypothetical protein
LVQYLSPANLQDPALFRLPIPGKREIKFFFLE